MPQWIALVKKKWKKWIVRMEQHVAELFDRHSMIQQLLDIQMLHQDKRNAVVHFHQQPMAQNHMSYEEEIRYLERKL